MKFIGSKVQPKNFALKFAPRWRAPKRRVECAYAQLICEPRGLKKITKQRSLNNFDILLPIKRKRLIVLFLSVCLNLN